MYKFRNFVLPDGGPHTDILRIADGAAIPIYAGNRDYDECMAWVGAGNVIAPADPPAALLPAEQKLKDDTAAALAYQKLISLSNMSPAQIQTWIAANVTNLAQAQDAICTLAIGLSVLIRRVK